MTDPWCMPCLCPGGCGEVVELNDMVRCDERDPTELVCVGCRDRWRDEYGTEDDR